MLSVAFVRLHVQQGPQFDCRGDWDLQGQQAIGFQFTQELFHILADGARVAFELIVQLVHQGMEAERLRQQGPDSLADGIEADVSGVPPSAPAACSGGPAAW